MPAVKKALDQSSDERIELLKAHQKEGPRKKPAAEAPAEGLNETDLQLLNKYGVYQMGGVEVTDYHTQKLRVPAAIFKKLREDAARLSPGENGKKPPAMQVLINVERTPGSSTQMIGVARRDLYLLEGDYPFWINFLKGAVAIWLGACLVLGIAVIASTYLSGIIAFLATGFLCGAGLFSDYIRSLAEGRTEGGREGGPMGSMVRLWNRQNINAPLDKSTGQYGVIVAFDDSYRWLLKLLMRVIPDVTRYDLAIYVSNGFDISLMQVLFLDNLLPLLAYLVPCGILGYYLMKSREIANPT